MQVEELIEYLHWINAEVRSRSILKHYQRLQGILAQNSQQSQQQPIESQRDALTTELAAVDLDKLNRTQLEFARKTRILEVIGPESISTLEDILYKNAIDTTTAASRVEQMRALLESILDRMQYIYEGLSPYVEAASCEYEEALIHIRFQRESSISNVTDLKEWGIAWYDIARGIAMAHHKAPEEVRVVGASKGSLIYDLAATYAITHTLAAIILSVLKVVSRGMDIRKKAAEIRALDLQNAANEIELEAKRIETEGRELALADLKASHTYDGEQSNALSKAIDRIFDFLVGGGEVDIYIEKTTETTEENSTTDAATKSRIAEIRQALQEIKRIEAKILHLGQGEEDSHH